MKQLTNSDKTNTFYNKWTFRGSLILYLLNGPTFLLLDPALISPETRNVYIVGRAINLIFFAFLLIQSFYVQYQWHLIAIFLGLMFHSIFGQFFLPCYFLGYMETCFVASLLLPVGSKKFYTILLTSMAAMLYSINTSHINYTSGSLDYQNKFYFDSTMGILITTALAIFLYHFFTRVRNQKDLLMAKFLDVGKNTSSIIHDFKGLLSTPLMYSNFLQNNCEGLDPKIKEIIKNLQTDLEFLHNYVINTNSLNITSESPQSFNFSEVVKSISCILSNHSSRLKINLDQDFNIIFNKNLTVKVLYNLIMNSIEAQDPGKPVIIDIYHDKKYFYVRDNGPGFSPKTLKTINSNEIAVSNKEGGSSVGVLISKEYLQKCGSNLQFENAKNGTGAIAKIKLPN